MFNSRAKIIIHTLNSCGYNAYYVGGCVRDHLLNIPFKDIDITTNAVPSEVMAIFEHTVPTGIDYGTVTVLIENESFEVTTFRKDLNYQDGRRPTAVDFSDTIEDDLSRRDFTINAIAMTADGALIDPYSGQQAIHNGIIDTVGLPENRLREDKLRKLRAIRLASQKQFNLSSRLKDALSDDPCLLGVSSERIFSEINKLLLSDAPEIGLHLLSDTKIICNLDPAFCNMIGLEQQNPYHKYDVYEHTINVVKNTPKVSHLRWAALLHDIGKPACKTIDENGIGHFHGHEKVSVEIARKLLNRLNVSNDFKHKVLHLILHHSHFPVLKPKPLRRFIKKIGADNVDDLLLLMRADALGKGTSLGMTAKKIEHIQHAIDAILTTRPPLSLKDLAVNGNDLLIAMPELTHNKKRIGITLNALLDLVIENPDLNQKSLLIKLAKEL